MKEYKWGVVGAGPAGIAAVGKLLDYKIKGKDIIWIDPEFTVGDFGSLWKNVPSNTKVGLFIRYLNACKSFGYNKYKPEFELQNKNINETCYLKLMRDPLQWVTNNLMEAVNVLKGFASSISKANGVWEVTLQHSKVKAQNIILAQGATPKDLPIDNKEKISLQDGIDFELIKNKVSSNDTVGVFGSSHSAVLILQNLVNEKVKKIINFYRSPLLYAIYYDNWVLYDDCGLKGEAAIWAKKHLENNIPKNLLRIQSNKENTEKYLKECNKIICAVGLERRSLPNINGIEQDYKCDLNGRISENLYGIGIAYPEPKYNTLGMLEHRVGLWKFMDYLDRVMPCWI